MFRVTQSPAPRANFIYDDTDIVDAVKADFFNKCYLCEEQVRRHLEVEHFFPQAHFPNLINDWSNLICICEKCNKIRPKNVNTQGNEVLNPCNDAVDEWIELTVIYDDAACKIKIVAHHPNHLPTTNTVALLERVHNGIDSTSLSFRDLRILIQDELSKFEKLIENYFETTNQDGNRILIQEKLSNKSPFTAVKRWYVRNDVKFSNEFSNLFD